MALQIKAVLDGDGTGFFRMMGRAEASVKRFGANTLSEVKGLIAGAFTVGAIAALTKETIEFASHMRDLADTLNVNVEWLQKMQGVLKQNGGSADDLAKTLNAITRNRALALGAGGEGMMAAFGKFGFNSADIAHLPVQQMMEEIAKAFENGNQQELIPAFEMLGGKGARAIIASFTENLKQNMSEVDIIPEDVIDQLDDLGDAFTRLKTSFLSDFAPIIITFVDQLTTLLRGFKVGAVGAMSFFKHILGLQDSAQGLETTLDFGTSFKEAIADAMFKANEEVAADAAVTEGRAKRRNRRQAKEGAALNIEPIAQAQEKQMKLQGSSDALTAVGNFLGGGIGDNLSRLTEKTNQLLTQGNQSLAAIDQHLAMIAGGLTDDIP